MPKPSEPPLPALGELELAALERLWSAGEADVSEVHAAIGRARGISPNTVGSALERLHRKDLVRRRKVSYAYRYEPAMDRETFHVRRMMQAVGGVRALADSGVLAAFVDAVAEVDAETLERLSALIEARREGER